MAIVWLQKVSSRDPFGVGTGQYVEYGSFSLVNK